MALETDIFVGLSDFSICTIDHSSGHRVHGTLYVQTTGIFPCKSVSYIYQHISKHMSDNYLFIIIYLLRSVKLLIPVGIRNIQHQVRKYLSVIRSINNISVLTFSDLLISFLLKCGQL